VDLTVSLPVIAGAASIPVSWGRVDTQTLRLPSSCFRRGRQFAPTQIVLHHDATFSSVDAARILRARGLSYHFSIDNDGTIYQLVDVEDTAWHAKDVNARSIGISMSNAVDLRHADRYEPPRPRQVSRVHGTTVQHLGWYDVQVHAARALVRALAEHYDIPLWTPDEAAVVTDRLRPGIYGHYHFDRGKIDPIGLDFKEILRP
jgi:N-acetyl-anhydromuramyl-L-alanine amidase AmpD